jgi:hypothetical protein
MTMFKTRDRRDWEKFLRTASLETLSKERWAAIQRRREIKKKISDIQAEVDRRAAENPPERGQEVSING